MNRKSPSSRPLQCVFCFRRYKYESSRQAHVIQDHSSDIIADSLNQLKREQQAKPENDLKPMRVSVIKRLENYVHENITVSS